MAVRARLRRLFRDEALQETVDDLREQLDRSLAAQHDLVARTEKLEKRLGMAMGAVQAATSQLMTLQKAVDEARTTAQQANQKATSALSTAESAADAVAEL